MRLSTYQAPNASRIIRIDPYVMIAVPQPSGRRIDDKPSRAGGRHGLDVLLPKRLRARYENHHGAVHRPGAERNDEEVAAAPARPERR